MRFIAASTIRYTRTLWIHSLWLLSKIFNALNNRSHYSNTIVYSSLSTNWLPTICSFSQLMLAVTVVVHENILIHPVNLSCLFQFENRKTNETNAAESENWVNGKKITNKPNNQPNTQTSTETSSCFDGGV